MEGLPGAGYKYVLDTRPLLNFTYTDRIALLEELLGKPIYVPAEVHRQWKGARSGLERKMRVVPPQRHEPFEVQKLEHLSEHLLDEMRLSWPRAPTGKLGDYLKGRRAVW